MTTQRVFVCEGTDPEEAHVQAMFAVMNAGLLGPIEIEEGNADGRAFCRVTVVGDRPAVVQSSPRELLTPRRFGEPAT